MNAGWVAIRRGIIDHVTTGKLTSSEYLAMLQLILLADASTGGGTINGPTLLYWLGQPFSLDTAERVLSSLHRKRYIWYRPSSSKKAQPYWINSYELSRGPKATRRTTLSQLFDKSTISDADVLRLAEDGSEDAADHSSEHGSEDGSEDRSEHAADDNNKDKDPNNDKYKETDRPSLSVVSEANTERFIEGVNEERASATTRTGRKHSGSASPSASMNASPDASFRASPSASPPAPGPAHITPLGSAFVSETEAGLRWSGSEGQYRDSVTGRAVPHEDARRRLGI